MALRIRIPVTPRRFAAPGEFRLAHKGAWHRVRAHGARSRRAHLRDLRSLELPTIAFRSDAVPTFVFRVDEMVSGSVARVVTQAVKALDPRATSRTNWSTQRLDVESASSNAQDLVDMLAAAGFTVTLVASTAESVFAWVDDSGPPDAATGPTMP